jgi:hypothetical protein
MWQRHHLLRCHKFPKGSCCQRCQANWSAMTLHDLDGGDVAYVCCSEELQNGEVLGR